MREKDLNRFYEALKFKAQRSSYQTVHIYVSANDVDSLAACKIIAHVLKTDSIAYSILPAAGYETILKYKEDIEEDDEAYTAVFVNCGGTEDLAKRLKVGKQTSFFIVDSHRPIHLQNLNQHNDRVMVLLGEDESTEEIDKMADLTEADVDVLEGVEDEEDDDEDSGYEVRSSKRARTDGVLKQLITDRKEYHDKGSSYGVAAGMLMFKIANLLRKDTQELLWYACLALTDQLVHLRIDPQSYEAWRQELENQIASAGNAEAPQPIVLEDRTTIQGPETFRIQCQNEPRLVLMKEWTMYDSMLRSLYTATTLKTWEEEGEGKMKQLLAKMGVPLKECKQRYLQMSYEIKRRLEEEFDRHSGDYILGELYYRSFHFYHSYKIRLSAADVIHSVTAILEDWEDEERGWADNFWRAVSAMTPGENVDLQKGFELAIGVSMAIFRQASLLLAKKEGISMSVGRLFYSAKLDDLADTELLQHPMALSKLIHFLLEAGFRDGWRGKRGWRERPLVIAVVSPNKPLALVVAVSHRPRLENSDGNKFGMYMARTATNLGMIHRHDGFESSWIYIDKDKVDVFLGALAEEMSGTLPRTSRQR